MSSGEYVEAHSSDVDDIFLLDKSEKDTYSYASISSMVLGENSYTLVCKMRERMVGYANFSIAVDEAELIKIVVDKDYRRQGIASNLLEKSLVALKNRGVKIVFLEVRIDNEGAKKCYEKMGFEHYFTRPKYYNGIDAMLYRLKFDDK